MLNPKLKSIFALKCVLFVIFVSCRKETVTSLEETNSGSQLMFSISEQTGISNESTTRLRASALEPGIPNKAKVQQPCYVTENGAFKITISVIKQPSASGIVKSPTKNKFSPHISSTKMSLSKSILKDGTKYRVVLYDRSTTPSTFVSSTVGIAGQKLLIDVDKGKDYDWAVYSFNDEDDPGEDKDVITARSGLLDLLHANGTTGKVPGVSGDGQEVLIPIDVILQHKLANISVQVSAKDYPARIIDIDASFGRGTMFCKNILDIRTGAFTGENRQIQMDATIPFQLTGNDSVLIADYYTSKFQAISNYYIKLNKLDIRTSSNELKSLSFPVEYHWDDVSPVQGEKVITKIEIQPQDSK